MKTRVLGRTGFTVSEVGFGGWAVGGGSYGAVPESQAEATVAAYLEAGGTFIDTARNYRDSERIIGSVVSRLGVRDRITMATKTSKTTSVEQANLIAEDLDTSRRLLSTDVIDLYFIHSPSADPETMKRVIEVFEKLKADGKIRAIGASIKGPDVTADTVALCRRYVDSGSIDAIQLIYSVFRQRNAESIAYAAGQGVGIVARTVMESGFLTGKYGKDTRFGDGDHRRRWGGTRLEHLLAESRRLGAWAVVPPFESLAQTAIAFALAEPGVSTTIPGARTPEQARSNTAVGSLPHLSADLVQQLRESYRDFNDLANTGSR